MRHWRLALIGFAVFVSLWSAGFVIVQEAQRNRERAEAICTQVTELREDIIFVIESQDVPMEQVNRIRGVVC